MDYHVGQKLIATKNVTKQTVQDFANISGDYNPLHINDEYGKNSRFKACIVHGMAIGAFISAVIGTEFPGLGSIYLEQNLKFLKPIYIDEKIEIVIEIIEIQKNNCAQLKTDVMNGNYELAVSGFAKVILPSFSQ